MLDEFVTMYREEIIQRCRAKVANRKEPPPTDAEINHGVPMFLDQLVHELRSGPADSGVTETAKKHGQDLRRQGFTVGQVVHDYGDVCQSITELALQTNVPIRTDDFRTLNRCLDNAIAGAVTEFGREREEAIENGAANVAKWSRQLRDALTAATLAFDIIKSGQVGASGSTGKVMAQSLVSANDAANRLITQVTPKRTTPEPVEG